MTTESRILARYESLASNGNGVTHAVEAMPADLTPAHLEVVNLLRELITLGEQNAPPGLALLTRALRRLEPQLLESFGQVDPDAVVEFLHRLGHRFLAVCAEEQGGAQPRVDQPS